MKIIGGRLSGWAIVGGLIASSNFVHAQTTTVSIQSLRSNSADDMAVMLQAVEAATPLPATNVPSVGTFYSAKNPNLPPMPGNVFGLDAWDLDGGYFLLDDLNVSNTSSGLGMRAVSASLESADPLESGYEAPIYGSNDLWLEITGMSNSTACFNLHGTTDIVYEVWSKTDLLASSWNIEQEIWPSTNQTVTAFTVPQLNRTNLFIWARDWTGITSNGNETPEWWFWKFFHTVALSDTNLDSQGNTLLSDYNRHRDPNVINFIIVVTNNYVNTTLVPLQLNISAGTPSYISVVDSTNFTGGTTWNPYVSSNIVINLGSIEGKHYIWIGLHGLPSDAQQTWYETILTLDTTVPVVIVTNPLGSTVSQPFIQVQGFADENLSSLTYDVSNAAGIFTNQTGYITGDFYDTNFAAFTTNYFQLYDVPVTNGVNAVTIHGTDLAGNIMTTNFNVTLDYSSDTTPPALNIVWPPDGTYISGSQFTLQAQVDDPLAKVTVTVVDSGGNTNTVQGLVERNGTVWAQNLPLAAGGDPVTVTATDAAGNAASATLTVYQSGVTVTMTPLTSGQLNQSSVSVSGTISDTNYSLTVNGVSATVNGDGTWNAYKVPASRTGTATFDVEVYAPSGSAMIAQALALLPDDSTPPSDGSQKFPVSQPVEAVLAYYEFMGGVEPYANVGSSCGLETWNRTTIDWTRGQGGVEIWDVGWHNDSCQGHRDYSVEDLTPDDDYWDWEYAETRDSAGWQFGIPFYQSFHVRTKVALDTGGAGQVGETRFYLVSAQAIEPVEYNFSVKQPLPPEWLKINGQTLVNSGITNDDYWGAVWGETVVSAPAGVLFDVTPTATQVYGNWWDYLFNVRATEVNLQLAVDANRDGNITFDIQGQPGPDHTSADKPYRFWVNDSKESGDDESSGGADDQIPGQSYFNANYSLAHVNGSSDLVNFFPVALCLSNVLQWLPPTNGWEYHLTQNDVGLPAGMGNGAVKFVYTSLSPTNAFDYLTNTAGFGYGTNSDEWATNADTIQVLNTPGTVLDTNWLAQVQNNGGYGVILVEGCAAATQPLMLEIWHNGQKMVGVPLYLSISGVEQMFRHLNFSYVNGTVEVPARSDAPNEPQTNGKNLVFLHGYNVNQPEARGVESEMFKRFYWSGSKAKFYGVTWNGAESKGTFPFYNLFTPTYHTNVVNALQTAPHLASFLNGLSGETTVAAHSLGNMVVLSAISDYNATIGHYFMVDAAVPMEAIQGDMAYNPNMLYSTWNPYANRLFASDWWQLFTNDYRSTLTWSNRVGNLRNVDVYNFYSSGEEVLREYDSDPPSTVLGGVGTELLKLHIWDGLPFGIYAWVWQEKGKGACSQDWFIGSSHGGWRFSYYWRDSFGNPLSPSIMNDTPNSILQNQPMFSVGSSLNAPPDEDLLGEDASAYAQAHRDRILSDAIPALTLPVGANFVSSLGATHNFNMSSTDFESGWPSGRSTGVEAYKWHHSDFDYVAYPFTHGLFDKIVTLGSLNKL